MKLSVVATLYHSESYIKEFCARVASCARKIVEDDYEIVLVNDGSPDNSLEKAIEMTHKDSRIVVVDLTRNFGHHKAIMAGLESARGDYIFVIDIDLEEDPELLLDFWEEMKRKSVDLVNGQQVCRKGDLFEKVSGSLYYGIYNFLSNTKIQPNLTMAKLMTRRFKESLIRYQERSFFLGGVLALVGYEVSYFQCSKKYKGTTTYNLGRKIKQALDSIVSFSARPLYYLVAIGASIFVMSILSIAYFIFRRLAVDTMPDGWTSIIVITLGMSGLVVMAVGIVGVYIAKLFEEVKARPNFIVKKIYGGNK